jgi:hypothetical protein
VRRNAHTGFLLATRARTLSEEGKLSSTGPFERIPHGRYINFVSDFLAHEPNATHAGAIRAWKALKRMDAPKDDRSWKRAARSRKRVGA